MSTEHFLMGLSKRLSIKLPRYPTYKPVKLMDTKDTSSGPQAIDTATIIHMASIDQLPLIMQIIPYLQQRRMCALKYNNTGHNGELLREELLKQIEYCNKEIAKILGL